MEIEMIHNFTVQSEEEFLLIQENLTSSISLINNFCTNTINLCAGVDLAYWEKDDVQFAVCCIVVIDYQTKEVLEKVFAYDKITTPYIAGFLAFRELPLIIEAVKKLKLEPDIFIFDGNGYLHFNHMGIATHASFFLNKPTIGVAKSYLKIAGVDFDMPDNHEGAFTDIVIKEEVYGRVLRTTKNVKPIFVSCGNYIDLDTCTKITLNLVNQESRIPIPTRLADIETHRMRDELKLAL